MRVKIRYLGRVWDILKKKEEIIVVDEETRLLGLLRRLSERHGKNLENLMFDKKGQNLSPYVRVTINGRDISALDGLNTRMQDGDVLAIFPPVSGG